jgi:plasmid stability protein
MRYAVLKSRSSTLVAGAKGVARNDHCANLKAREFPPFRGIANQLCGRAAIHGRVAQHERMSPFRAGPAGPKLGDLLNALRGSKACPERSRREQGCRPKDHCANLKAREFPPFRGIANQFRGRAAIHGRVARHERISPFRAGLAGTKSSEIY